MILAPCGSTTTAIFKAGSEQPLPLGYVRKVRSNSRFIAMLDSFAPLPLAVNKIAIASRVFSLGFKNVFNLVTRELLVNLPVYSMQLVVLDLNFS
jgi:hypothetical protein